MLSLKSNIRTTVYLGFVITNCLFGCINGEIEVVTLKWTPLLCTDRCMQLLEREFKRVPEIAEATLNQSMGQARLKWQKNAPFSFSIVNIPMRLVGLSIRDIHIKVRGNLSHDSSSVTLTSIGDHTRFELLNPVVTTPGMQAPVFNLASRRLSPELREKLLEAESQKMEATIEGQLFMPGRTPSNQIVVGQMSFKKPEEEQSKQNK